MRTESPYRPRVADAELQEQLRALGAVLIEGPKACGKTWTATHAAGSRLDVDLDPSVRLAMEADPRLLLEGKTTRLLDEWQMAPRLWNYVRREVDARQRTGQFILTGSATPGDQDRAHSGAGRIGWLRMRPMSLWESDDSSGEVRLRDLFEGAPVGASPDTTSVQRLAELVVRGGWPASIGRGVAAAQAYARSHLRAISEVELSHLTGRRRDPVRVRRLIRSLARNESSEASLRTLAADTGGAEGEEVSRVTVTDYLNALERIMVVEDQPAWSASLRSRATLRSSPVRHLADPSLAAAALTATPAKLMRDLATLGLLFESLVIRDLRVYAQAVGGRVYHYRDSNGHEIDAVVELEDGSWGACEVKLGAAAAEEGASSLRAAVAQVNPRVTGEPAFMAVITGNGVAVRREDGIYVVPIGSLRP